MTDTADALRSEVTRRLAPYLPAHLTTAAADSAATWADRIPAGTDAKDAAAIVRSAVVAVLPSPYREASAIALAIGEAAAAWWSSRVVEVQAGSATVTDHRKQ